MIKGIFVLLVITSVISCDEPTSTQVNVKSYSKQIYLANESSEVGDYVLALSHLDTAFTVTNYSFAIDIQKALDLAIDTKDQERVLRYVDMLLKRMCPLSYFQTDRLAFMDTNPKWDLLLSSFEDEPNYLGTINLDLRKQMKELYAKDQNIAINFKNANLYYKYQNVTNELISIEKEYGFPGEAITGVRMESETVIGSPYYYVIMLHHYHKKESLFYDKLDSFVESEMLDPRHCEIYKSQGIVDAQTIARINARRKVAPKTEILQNSIPIYENEPIYKDTYLYPTEVKNVTNRKINDYDIFFTDWNNDSIFTEVGVDYFGFNIEGESLPKLFLLDTVNHFMLNGKVLAYCPLANNIEDAKHPGGDIPTFIDQLLPLPLIENDTIKFDLEDDVILYFWASWCAPCIQKLEKINLEWDAWSNKKYRFIPVALESSKSSIEKIYERKKFKFPMNIGEYSNVQTYSVNSFPKIYKFENGKLKKSLSSDDLFEVN